MAIGTAAAIGLGVAGAGSFLGSKSQAKAANKAADAQLQATQENNALAREIYGENKDILNPYVLRGNQAGEGINALLGFGDPARTQEAYSTWRNSTGYQNRLNEGMNALDASFAANGTRQSGAAVKEALRYNQNFAANDFQNYANLLGNQQGVGLSGASALAGVGQNFVNTISANNNNAADARSNAALIRGQNNPLANSLSLVGGGLFGMQQW